MDEIGGGLYEYTPPVVKTSGITGHRPPQKAAETGFLPAKSKGKQLTEQLTANFRASTDGFKSPLFEAYMDNSRKKYDLTETDIQKIISYEMGHLKSAEILPAIGGLLLVFAAGSLLTAIPLGIAGAVLPLVMFGGGGVIMGLFGFAILHGAPKIKKATAERIAAVCDRNCAAYLLEISDKMWYYSSGEVSDTYEYYITLGDIIAAVPPQIYNCINRHILAVKFFYDSEGTVISIYPAAV
jgi:hypothetical protein